MEPTPDPAFSFDPERYPPLPGCFVIKDESGRALLAGGTVNLRRRLATLFAEGAQPPRPIRVVSRFDDRRFDDRRFDDRRFDDRIPRLVALAHEIEVFLLPDNADCPALANSLIERDHPLFNLATYMEPSGASFITLTSQPFPRFVAGQIDPCSPGSDAADCFGPFPSVTRDLLLKAVNDGFGLRTCQPMPRKACISYQMKLCSAPCEGRISREAYAARVAQAAAYLSAPGEELIESLQAQVQAAAQAHEVTRARRIRKQIEALKPAIQRITSERAGRRPAGHDQDAVYLAGGKALVVCVRRGAVREMRFLDAPAGAEQFLREAYVQCSPPELVLGGVIPQDSAALAEALSASNGAAVALTLPGSTQDPAGELLEIARLNHAWRTTGSWRL